MKPGILIVFLCCAGAANAQFGWNTTVIGNIQYQEFVNDVWGYTDSSGNDYALVGLIDGVSIVKVEANGIFEVDRVPGVRSIWRDLKTHSHYAYVTNQASSGLQIIDLSTLPDSARLVKNDDSVFAWAHNLFIADSFAYIAGSNNGLGGADILSLADPENPVLVGNSELSYYHDIFVQRDTMYTSTGTRGSLAIFDVADKSAPRQIGEVFLPPPAGYSHNAWVSADGRYAMTTEETSGKTIKMWDISDLQNPVLLSDYLSSPGNLAHNVTMKGDFAFISHYGDGLRIVDIADPESITEVGFYDTFPPTSTTFDGDWGVFPFTNSGAIYASDESTGLTVVTFNGRRASRVHGMVLDSQTGQGIDGVKISPFGQRTTRMSNEAGEYSVGFSLPSTYRILFTKAGYDTGDVTVTLAAGENVPRDVMLNPVITAVEDGPPVTPSSYTLAQNFPNPFNAGTTIRYTTPERARITLRIYDLLGHTIATLVDEVQSAGEHRVNWNGKNAAGNTVASGVYFYELTSPNFRQVSKMAFLR